MSLTAKTCTPCQGGIDPLSKAEAERMMAQIPGWQLADAGNRLTRTWKFKDFAQALAYVNRVGELAEQEGHHPDFKFGWGYVTVELWTHKIGGLHENDFILAAKVSNIAP